MTDTRALRVLADVSLGKMRTPESDTGSNLVPYLRAANVGDGALRLDDVKSMHFEPAEFARHRLAVGDVLVTEASGSRDQVGQTALYSGEVEGAAMQNTLLRLRAREGTAPRYLYWWSRFAFASGLYAEAAQGLGIWHLGSERMQRLHVPVLPVPDQLRIADFLDERVPLLDRAIELRQRQVDLLQERERAHVDTVLGGLLTASPLIPVKHLVRESDERDGGSVDPPPLMSVSIHRGVVPRSDLTDKEPQAEDLANYKICRAGDVVLNRMRAFQGGVGVAGTDGLVSPDYAVLRPLHGTSPEWLNVLFRSGWFVSEMAKRLRGLGAAGQGTVRTPRINVADLGLIKVPRLDTHEQIAVVRDVSADRSWRSDLARLGAAQAELLTERRQATITAAVTGGLDMATARSVA